MKCYNRFDKNYEVSDQAKAFSSLQVADGKEWYPDYGASAHITSSTNNLQSATQYDGNDTVMVADGTYISITQIGSMAIASPSGMIY